MLIRMLVAERVAANGRDVLWRKEGEILDLPGSLAESMIRAGIATRTLITAEADDGQDDLPLAHQPKAELKLSKKREYRAK